MRTLACALLLLAVLPAFSGIAQAATLAQRLARAVAASPVRGQASVIAYRADTQQVIYTYRAGRIVTPASTQKAYTAAAALRALGPEHRFRTRLLWKGTQVGSNFYGHVYLVGGGDPTLSTPVFGRRHFGENFGNLGLLTYGLRARGITKVHGRLVVDDSYLDRQRYVSTWKTAFRYDEATALGALTVNQSYTGPYLSGTSSRTPDLFAGAKFRSLLAAKGVYFTGRTLAGVTPADATEIAMIESPRVRTIIRFMNKFSDNFTAEILLKDLGKEKGTAGSTLQGAAVVGRELAAMGVPTVGMRIADGSGLSYYNRTNASQVVNFLNIADRSAWGPYFVASLAVNGRPGTLRRRLAYRPYIYRIKGKTGTLKVTSALSGYATRTTGRRYGFSVLVHSSGGVSVTNSRALQNRVAAILIR